MKLDRVQTGPAYVSRRRALDQPFLLGVAIEAGNRAQPTSDGRPSTTTSLEIAGEALDVRPADGEQPPVVLLAPGDELAQVHGVGVAGEASVAGEERRQGIPLSVGELEVDGPRSF